MLRICVSGFALLAFYAALQLFVLAPDGVFTGDQGTKLLQTRAALANGPLTPWVEGPANALDPELRYHEPSLVRARDGRHVVGLFPLILPAVTAPFYGVFDLRGLYVVPAISVFVTFLAAYRLGEALHRERALVSAWCAVAATPVLFYGAELWEHAPAAALTTIAAAAGVPRNGAATIRSGVLGGALIGVAAAFRPEAALVAVAIVVARLAPGDARAHRLWRWTLGVATGCAVTVVASLAVNEQVYGTISPHVAHNFSAGSPRLRTTHGETLRTVLLPHSGPRLLLGAMLLAIVTLAVFPKASRARVLTCHGLVALLVWFAVGEPAWRSWQAGTLVHGAFTVTSIAHTWPFAFLIVYVLALPRIDVDARIARYLLCTVLVFIGLAVLTMPNTGGTQWSPRYLLPAAPLAAVLASAALGRFNVRPFDARTVRVAAAAVLALSVVVQLLGLRILARDKARYAAFGQAVERLTAPGDVVVSDLFWVPEVLARLYPSRALLFARTAGDVGAILEMAARNGATRVAILTIPTEGGDDPPPAFVLPAGTFARVTHHDLGARDLRLHMYRYTRH